MGSSTVSTFRPVAFVNTVSIPRSSAPPPQMYTPLSIKSAANSGSAFSSVAVTVSMIVAMGSWRASRISSLVITIFLGRPETVSLPAISIVNSSCSGAAEPICILTFSALASPMSRL
ncbi:hypothetical protein ES703_62620 [subsurface metagenome]